MIKTEGKKTPKRKRETRPFRTKEACCVCVCVATTVGFFFFSSRKAAKGGEKIRRVKGREKMVVVSLWGHSNVNFAFSPFFLSLSLALYSRHIYTHTHTDTNRINIFYTHDFFWLRTKHTLDRILFFSVQRFCTETLFFLTCFLPKGQTRMMRRSMTRRNLLHYNN